MRVDYKVGAYLWKSEWVCFEHSGYARQRAVDWWQRRSREPVPRTAGEAVALAQAGALAETRAITVRYTPGEKYDRVIGYELGPVPELAERGDAYEDDIPGPLTDDMLDFPFGLNAPLGE